MYASDGSQSGALAQMPHGAFDDPLPLGCIVAKSDMDSRIAISDQSTYRGRAELIGPEKRACVYRFNSTCLVCRNSEISKIPHGRDRAFTRSCGSFCEQPLRVLLRAGRFIDTNPAFRYFYFRPGLTSVKTLRPLWLLLLCGQFSSAQTVFTKPSEAYEYGRRPLTEWETAIREHRQPATPTIRPDIVQQRGKGRYLAPARKSSAAARVAPSHVSWPMPGTSNNLA